MPDPSNVDPRTALVGDAPALPTAPVIGYQQPAAGEVRYAGFGLRLVAWFIDWAIISGLRLLVMLLLGMVVSLIDTDQQPMPETARGIGGVAILLILYLLAWPYYALAEASPKQATIGKRTLGIHVADVDGGPATFTQTSVRFFLRLVSGFFFGLGYLFMLVSRRGQTLHDMGSNCVVLTGKPVPAVTGAP